MVTRFKVTALNLHHRFRTWFYSWWGRFSARVWYLFPSRMIAHLCLKTSERETSSPLAGPDPRWAIVFEIIITVIIVLYTCYYLNNYACIKVNIFNTFKLRHAILVKLCGLNSFPPSNSTFPSIWPIRQLT